MIPIHKDLSEAQKRMYEPCGLLCTNIVQELESKEYSAHEFEINDYRIKFRVAKITPKKIGQFVTLWKRYGNGPIEPFDSSDPIDFVIVSVKADNRFGQFIFPKVILVAKGVFSQHGMGGKRAMRIYPPWDIVDNDQARKSQMWQRNYFFPAGQSCNEDIKKFFLRS